MERKVIQLTQAQKTMVFVLSMSLYGLSTLFTELIPKVQIGLIEFSVEYFLFIPLTLAILFDPLMTALGAATGEVIFGEIMLGQFGGLGEVEKFVTITIGIFIAGKLVKDVTNKYQIAFASFLAVTVQQGLGMIVDILKVQLAVEDFEAVAGLPESVFFTEGFAFLNDVLFSGILFCVLPTMYLVPKLHGKIEPLLGMQPKDPSMRLVGSRIRLKFILTAIGAFVFGTVAEVLSEMDMGLIDWEASWAESLPAFGVAIIIAALVVVLTISRMRKKRGLSLD